MHRYANMKHWKYGAGDSRTVIFKALACEHRIHILEALKYGEQNVSEIASLFSIHPSVVSRHLAILQMAGLVVSKKKGAEVYYRLSSDDVLNLIKDAEKIAKERNRY